MNFTKKTINKYERYWKNIKDIINTKLIFDTVKEISTSKIYSKKSPYFNQKFWVLNCLENEIKVLPLLGNDKVGNLVKEITKGTLINKKFCFTITKVGNYLVDVEEIAEV